MHLKAAETRASLPHLDLSLQNKGVDAKKDEYRKALVAHNSYLALLIGKAHLDNKILRALDLLRDTHRRLMYDLTKSQTPKGHNTCHYSDMIKAVVCLRNY